MSQARRARSAAASGAAGPEVARITGAPGPKGKPVLPGADQRVGPRRRSQSDRGSAIQPAPRPVRGWLPRKWPYVIVVQLAAIVVCAVAARGLPQPAEAAMLVASVVGTLCVGPLHRLVAGRTIIPRLLAAFAAVVAPFALFGLAVAGWSISGALPWDVAIASLLCLTGIAAAYLRKQPVLIFAAQLSAWSAAVVANGSAAGMFTVAVAFLVAALVSREQVRELRLEEDRKHAQYRVQTRARDILADYEETRQGWFWETDRRGLLTYVSAPVAGAIGLSPDDLIGQPLVALFDLADTGNESERTLLFHLTARSAFQELAIRAAIAGEERWWSVSGRPMHDQFGNFIGFRGSGTDLTAKKQSEELASRLALYDSLTGLANRFQMSQALEKALASRLKAGRSCGVMLLDLDRFKQVNDTMGHPAGDALLKQVARRLEVAVNKQGQVGRLGGDEFKVILPGRITRKEMEYLASNIIHSLSQPYTINGQRVVIGASVGIAVAPEDGTCSDEVIRNADLALYAAKDSGRGRYCFYADDLHAEAEARAKLERELRDAIANGELQLHYQPVVSAATEKVTGFEALLRWQHPVRGWIPTDSFVKIAEDTGLIMQIGEWALRTACHDLARWPEEIRVAVNVSPLQFANPQLPNIITNALAQAEVDPARLELEITETVFLADERGTDAMFMSLKGIGVRLALDDFGTGYSSLGYLKKAPFNKIKIDQSFVRGATLPGSRNGAIIASITGLAHALGMDTTAEGVETLDELDLVRMYGCSHVQGFIYERAMPADQVTERLQRGLDMEASGPRASRAPRQTMLRKVELEHDGKTYSARIRNVSSTGALLEGLWHVPSGRQFMIRMPDGTSLNAITRWCSEDRIGVEFLVPQEEVAMLGAKDRKRRKAASR